jgi:hypothetical protein
MDWCSLVGLARIAISFAIRKAAVLTRVGAFGRTNPAANKFGSRSKRSSAVEEVVGQLTQEIANQLIEEEVRQIVTEIISNGMMEALDTMGGLISNEGQLSVFETAVLPGFSESLEKSDIKVGWNAVVTEYDEFVGGIVEEGNQIMTDAYEEALEILQEIEMAEEAFSTIAGVVGLWWKGDELRFGINAFNPGGTLTTEQKISAGGIQKNDGSWSFPKKSYYKNPNFTSGNNGY